jgi:hypothetical protein
MRILTVLATALLAATMLGACYPAAPSGSPGASPGSGSRTLAPSSPVPERPNETIEVPPPIY